MKTSPDPRKGMSETLTELPGLPFQKKRNNLTLIIAIIAIFVGFALGWMSTTGSKSQYVRLGDIFIFGPIIIYAGLQVEDNDLLSIILIIIGASTMAYNYKNYEAERQKQGQETLPPSA